MRKKCHGLSLKKLNHPHHLQLSYTLTLAQHTLGQKFSTKFILSLLTFLFFFTLWWVKFCFIDSNLISCLPVIHVPRSTWWSVRALANRLKPLLWRVVCQGILCPGLLHCNINPTVNIAQTLYSSGPAYFQSLLLPILSHLHHLWFT